MHRIEGIHYRACSTVGRNGHYLCFSRLHDIKRSIQMTYVLVFIHSRRPEGSGGTNTPAYRIAWLLLTWRRGILWSHILAPVPWIIFSLICTLQYYYISQRFLIQASNYLGAKFACSKSPKSVCGRRHLASSSRASNSVLMTQHIVSAPCNAFFTHILVLTIREKHVIGLPDCLPLTADACSMSQPLGRDPAKILPNVQTRNLAADIQLSKFERSHVIIPCCAV